VIPTLTCPSCGDHILKTSDQSVKVRGKLLVFKSGRAFAVCKSCDSEVEVPLRIDDELCKAMVQKNPPLYVHGKYQVRK